tara:strand:- start:50 stop:520 length:471 start_codon:yes stop_codon:yes gene_type:complete
MKSFKQFNEDAYAGRQGAGAWLTGKALELGARGIKQGYKGIKALTSLASRKKSGEERLWDVIHQPPDDVKKDMEAPNLKKAPTKKDIKDIAKDNIRTRGSEAVKGQLIDSMKNRARDQRIKDVINNTKPGTMERARGLLGIPKAKKLPDPPKYKGK